jgi:hypothetical protein
MVHKMKKSVVSIGVSETLLTQSNEPNTVGQVKAVPICTMKAYRGSGGTAPLILNFSTR